MQDKIKPIFIVGSPRSGTSVLTWCLGQHPNIIPLEESGWMGDLAIDLAIRYQIGTARGDHSLLSSMHVEQKEFFSIFGKTINELIVRHYVDLERERWSHSAGPNAIVDDFRQEKSRTACNPKARWVDGTPEYSFHICGLRKLFPKAVFIHVIRDVTSVVRSLLNFHRVSGASIVANEQEAYDYWFRTVSSCLLAERAYGPRVVFRLRHSDFGDRPEATLRSLFNFLGEPFAAECLTPLQDRINSSNVPADFKIGDPETDPAVIERATQLCAEVEETSQPQENSPAVAQEIEAAFNERVRYVATLDNEYCKARQRAERLAKEIKGKRTIIEHLRGRRHRYKLLRLPWSGAARIFPATPAS